MYRIIGTDQKEYGPIDTEQVRQWLSQGRVHAQSLIRLEDSTQWQPLHSCRELASVLPPSSPPVMPVAPIVSKSGDAIATIIPYKNPQALIAYYLGLFSVFPVLGMFLGIAAFVLGVRGLRQVHRHPEAKGAVHAWIGIICGGFFGLIYLLFNILIIVALVKKK